MLIVLGAKALRLPKLHSRVWRDATSAPWHEQGLSTFYSVLDSLLIFAGIHSGAGYAYRQLGCGGSAGHCWATLSAASA